uniref:Uncharacterized protein n=1 Tax=Ditylenchus dipsaci TaxID=166011 RepID=A0A915DYA2_9BILA
MVGTDILYNVFCYLDATHLDYMEQIDSRFKALRQRYFSKFPLTRMQAFKNKCRKRVLELVKAKTLEHEADHAIVQTIVRVLSGDLSKSNSVGWEERPSLFLTFQVFNFDQLAGDVQFAFPEVKVGKGSVGLRLKRLSSPNFLMMHGNGKFSFAWQILRLDVCSKMSGKYNEIDYPVFKVVIDALSAATLPELESNIKWASSLNFVIVEKSLLAEHVSELYDIQCSVEIVDEELRKVNDLSSSDGQYTMLLD